MTLGLGLGLGLLPIVPILLLPFIIVLFVIVFPLWVVALGVVGLLLVVVRLVNWLGQRVGVHALAPAADATNAAFRWVLTFGGLAERARAVPAGEPTHVPPAT